MVEPSIWFSVHQWFTPTTLFVVLNLVIATIAITSKALRAGDDHPAAEPRKLARAPSLVFDRIRSFNLNLYRSPAPLAPILDPIPPSPSSPPDPVTDLTSEASDHEQLHFTRSQSDASPTAGEMPEKLAPKMKKSASVQSAFSHFEEKEIAPPPAPEEVAAAVVAPVDGGDGEEEGGEVDARADDFINRFRQQLKLQRLDSLLRYKEMINRGR